MFGVLAFGFLTKGEKFSHRGLQPFDLKKFLPEVQFNEFDYNVIAVSYTHLTLPTILRV